MYKNKYNDRNNIVGIEIRRRRQEKELSQRALIFLYGEYAGIW